MFTHGMPALSKEFGADILFFKFFFYECVEDLILLTRKDGDGQEQKKNAS
jgi:hypothetical protein